MARFNRSIRPVQSLKHVVDTATSAVLAIQSVVPVIQAVQNPTLANTTQINQGSTVNAIYLRVEVLSTGTYAGVPRIYMAVFKDPGGNLAPPNANAVGGSDNKKHIIHQEMIMIDDGSNVSQFPRTLFQGVILIPKRLRRFGYNDELQVLLQNGVGETSGIANACVQCIFKEFH